MLWGWPMSCVSRAVFLFAAFLASAILALPAGVAAQTRPQKLVVGLLPSEAPETILRLNEPLRAYLQKRLGMPVELRVGSTYVAVGEDLQLGRAGIAYLGPIVYLLRSRTAKLEAFARPFHEGVGPFFKVVTIVPAASSAKTLTDLKGAIIAFGDRASGAIWVVRYQLLQAGFIPGRDYIIRGMGDNTNVARAVTEGIVYAGSLSQPVFNRLIKEGKIDPKSVRVLAESPDIPEYMWTFRDGLDPAFKEEIRKAIFEVNDPEVLKVFRAASFIPSDEADLEQARKWIAATEAVLPGTVPKAR
jgi:phosphonate transport system substrate-binding protein